MNLRGCTGRWRMRRGSGFFGVLAGWRGFGRPHSRGAFGSHSQRSRVTSPNCGALAWCGTRRDGLLGALPPGRRGGPERTGGVERSHSCGRSCPCHAHRSEAARVARGAGVNQWAAPGGRLPSAPGCLGDWDRGRIKLPICRKGRSGGTGRNQRNGRRVTPRSPCHSSSPTCPALPALRPTSAARQPTEVACQPARAVGVDHEAYRPRSPSCLRRFTAIVAARTGEFQMRQQTKSASARGLDHYGLPRVRRFVRGWVERYPSRQQCKDGRSFRKSRQVSGL